MDWQLVANYFTIKSTDIFAVQGPINTLFSISAKSPSCSAEKVDFIGFDIFLYGGHFLFSIGMNFIILKQCSLVMLHGKFENHSLEVSENNPAGA